jgi:hypothetical protein
LPPTIFFTCPGGKKGPGSLGRWKSVNVSDEMPNA